MMKYTLIFISLLIFCIKIGFSQTQNIGIGTNTPDNSAILHLESADKGFLIPVTDTSAIANPADGLLIYLATANQFWYFDGNANVWKPMSSSQTLNYDTTTNILTLVSGGGSVNLTNLIDDADSDPTNEYNQNFTFNPTTNILTITDAGNSLSVDLTDLINDADADTTNELQDLILNGTELGLTNSSITVTLPSGGAAPQGIIVMWSGMLANIPTGWALCDGTNGTPNLLDRFVVSVGTGVNPGAVGGANTYSLTAGQLPSHTHTGSATTDSQGNHAHTGTTANAGSHSHTGSAGTAGNHRHTAFVSASTGASGNNKQVQNVNGFTGFAGDHTHPLSINANGVHAHTFNTDMIGTHIHNLSFTTDPTGSGNAVDNRPSYFEIAFIMKL